LKKIGHIALNTYRETIRDKVLYNLLLFALILIGSSYILGQISIYQEVKIIKDLGLAAISVFGTVIAIFIGIGLVSKEIEKRSLYSLLSKPVSRLEFLLGKYLGLCLTLAVNLAIMSAGLYLVLFYMTRSFDPELLKAIYLIYGQLALITALALMFSTFTSSLMSGVFTGFFFVTGHFSADLKNLDTVAESVWFPKLAAVMYYVLPNLRNFDIKARVVSGEPVPLSFLGYSTLYGLLYIGGVLIAAHLIFSRKNLK
jgi:ABC-type transport system involved in multi-copper enzyme maturation permease subunit